MMLRKPDDARAAGLAEEVLTGPAADAAVDATGWNAPAPGPDSADDDSTELPGWPVLEPDALHGLAGEVVRTMDPVTEADPAGILGTFLAGFGNAIGRGPYALADGTAHYGNLFLALVGDTATGRKGSAWERAKEVLKDADPDWYGGRIKGGLSSGEGLIHAVRDASTDPPKRKDDRPDPGESDKRLLAYESELAQPLRRGAREGNPLTTILRQAWDCGDLRTLTKHAPEAATAAHISIVAHAVPDELRRYLKDSEVSGGLGNRFLWLCVRRSKELPDGAALPSERRLDLVAATRKAIAFGKTVGEVRRDDVAAELWRSQYHDLTAGRPGRIGAFTGRAAPQVLRLSVLYAVLDGSRLITESHLRAALAFWRYCEASVRYLFGGAAPDDVANRILAALRAASPGGLTRTAIARDVFKGHVDKRRIDGALIALESANLAHRATDKVDPAHPCRPAERWYYGAKEAKEAKEGPGCGDAAFLALRTPAKEAKEGSPSTEPAPLLSRSFAGVESPQSLEESLRSHDSLLSQDSICERCHRTADPRTGAEVLSGVPICGDCLTPDDLADTARGAA